MTALGKLLRTTAFQLTLVYLVVFALFAAFLVGYFALNTRRLINEQIVGTVDTEVTALTNQYSQAGIRRLVVIVDVRSRRPGSSLYLITTPTGEGLAGNVASLEPGILDHDGWVETAYRRLEEPESAEHNALVRVTRLPGGIRLLVGRDLDERERMFHIVAVAGRWSVALVVVLGVLGGIFVSRRVLNRVEAMTATAQTIMAGDLSGRLSVTGSGDEFDRLALNLNGMLERIEALMHGLKEVTDNVAHDLKTPLTRLRNRCEAALRIVKTDADYRRVLEETIEESEGLIRTFDALLMIARAESGEVRDGMAEFDIADVARDVGELYEPLAEDKGLTLQIETNEHATVRGQSRARQSGACQPRRQRDQILGARGQACQWRAGGHRRRNQRRQGPHHAERQRSWAGNSGRRPFPGGRAVRSPRAEPHRARLRAGPEPRLRGRPPARR